MDRISETLEAVVISQNKYTYSNEVFGICCDQFRYHFGGDIGDNSTIQRCLWEMFGQLEQMYFQ